MAVGAISALYKTFVPTIAPSLPSFSYPAVILSSSLSLFLSIFCLVLSLVLSFSIGRILDVNRRH